MVKKGQLTSPFRNGGLRGFALIDIHSYLVMREYLSVARCYDFSG